MTRHVSTTLATALAFGLLLSGCSSTTEPSPSDAPPPASSTDSPGSDESNAPDAPESTPEAPGDSDAADVAVDELRDGTWQVGDAGEVEFSADGGTLSLTEVRPADGWQQRVTDEKPDEIEVHFVRGDQEWKFEVEFERGQLQLSKQLKIRGGASATFAVGSAATLEFTASDDSLAVAEVQPADGWTIAERDESPDDIEITFRNADGTGKAEFEAEFDRTGVKIEISQRLHGSLG